MANTPIPSDLIEKNSILKKLFSKKEIISDIVVLSLVEIYILSFFDINLILSNTTLAGGDTASHYAALHYLAKTLIPNWRLIGWDHGNFAGYPIFQFYFPVPFFLAAVLGFLIPLKVALKLVTLMGIFILPLFTYLGFRKLNYLFPVPSISSILVLPFIFNESYTMFGGNVLSTFAGEFCYGISFSVFVLYAASLYRGVAEKKGFVTNSILLSLCGLCHAIPFMLAVTLSLFFLIRENQFKDNLKYLLKVNTLAFFLMGFWVIPMVAKLKFTTPIYMIWNFDSFKDLIPPLIIPFLVLTLLRIIFFRFKFFFTNDRLYYFLYILAVSILLYINSHVLVVPDIRFIPFIYLTIIFIAIDLLGFLLNYVKPKIILTFLFLIFTGFWINSYVKDAGSWFKWNYEGYEGKRTWDEFEKINRFIKGDYQQPRVAYEKTPIFNAFGSDRAFESIPFFAGRQTLEGLHYSSGISAKAITFLQTEFSKEIMSPVSYIYSRPDMKNIPEKFNLFNINQIITASGPIKEMFYGSKEFKEVYRIKNFSIFEFLNCKNHYIEPLNFYPVAYTGKDWREEFSKWFKRADNLDIFLVPEQYISAKESGYFKSRTDSVSNLGRFRNEIKNAADCRIEEHIEPFKISFKTSRPGIPHLVKFSYFPNWKVKGADAVYPVSPSFMLVIPNSNEVVLTYGRTFPDILGIICSLLGFLFIISAPVINKKSGIIIPTILDSLLSPVLGLILRLKNYLFFLLLVLILISSIYSIKDRNLPVKTYLNGMDLYNNKQYYQAIKTFQRITRDEQYDLADTILCLLFEGRSHVQLKDYNKGIETFMRIINHYPYSRYVSEAYYEIGMTNLFQGKKEEAREFFKKAVEVDKSSNYSEYAKDRLKEIEKSSD